MTPPATPGSAQPPGRTPRGGGVRPGPRAPSAVSVLDIKLGTVQETSTAQQAAQPQTRSLPWPVASATGIGSMPGTDPARACAVVLGELPDFPFLPELPGRG